MSDQEFDGFLTRCRRELDQRQAEITPLCDGGAYHYDLDAGRLCVGDSTFQVSVIGTYCISQSTWLWGWANDSFSERARSASAVAKDLHIKTGFHVFLSPGIRASKEDAQSFVAMVVHHRGSVGFFRDAEGDRLLYLSLDSRLL